MQHTGIMIALAVGPQLSAQLLALTANLPDGSDITPADEMHVTVAYLGKTDETKVRRGDLADAVSYIAGKSSIIRGQLNGTMLFNKESDGKVPLVVSVDSDHLHTWREGVVRELSHVPHASVSHEHGFTPHITLAYVPVELAETMALPIVERQEIVFRSVLFAWGDEMNRYSMSGTFIKAIKAGESYALSVLAAPFGGPHDRDSDGEYFTNSTKFHLDRFTPQPVYYHGFTDAKQPNDRPIWLGQTTGHKTDNQGVWLDVSLDSGVPEAMEVWRAAKAGKAAASSGTIAHLMRKSHAGEILQWPMAEISLWPLAPDRPQANKRALASPALKAAGIAVPDELVNLCKSEDLPVESQGHGSDGDGDGSGHIFTDISTEDKNMSNKTQGIPRVLSDGLSADDIQALVNDQVSAALKAASEEQSAKALAAKAQQDAIDEAVKAERERLEAENEEAIKAAKADAVAARRIPFGDAPYQTKFGNLRAYDNLSPDDLAFAHGIMTAVAAKGGALPSEDLGKAIAVKFAESTDTNHGAAQAAMKMAGMPLKANELNQSTLSSYGDEWIGQSYSSQVWEKVRLETQIVSMLPTIEIRQGFDSETIPYDVSSPTFYRVAQATSQDSNPGRITQTFTSSKLGTGNRTISTQKIGAFVPWAQELTEDSIVRWVEFLRTDLMKEYAEVLEHCVIDGDTEAGATANVNDIAGTPTGTEPFTMFDGFRKLALVTNTANSRDGGALAATDYIDTVAMLGTAGVNGWDKSKVFMTSDINTAYATLKLSSLETRDNIASPTIESGRITQLYGYSIHPSANMHRAQPNRLANSAGKVDLDTAGNNTTGAIVAVRADQWMLGFKRRVRFEVVRDAGSDANEIYMHSRVGLINRDNEASAISYNITI